MSQRQPSPIVEASLRARSRVQRQGERRREEVRRLRTNLNELRRVLAVTRSHLAESDQLIAQMQREREATRRKCFELEETILEGVSRAIVLQSADGPYPTFIQLDDEVSVEDLRFEMGGGL